MTAPPPIPRRLRDSPRHIVVAVVLVTVAAAAIRVSLQSGRSFIGDEAGSIIRMRASYRELLTHFANPWLTMNVYLVATKWLGVVSGGNAWVMVLPTLVAGIAIVPLTAALAVRTFGPTTAVIAAVLAAANPYLVYYGVQLRSYMLLTVGCLGALVAYLDWEARPRWSRGWIIAAAFGFAVLMHLNAFYFALVLGAFLATHLVTDRGAPARRPWALATLFVPAAVAAIPVAVVYVPLAHDIATVREQWWVWGPLPTSIACLPWVLQIWLGNGWWALPSIALLVAGTALALFRGFVPARLALVLAVPVVALWLAGVSHKPWGFARYLIFAVPVLLVLIAAAVGEIGARRGRTVAACLMLVLVASWLPGLYALDAKKRNFPWTAAGAYLAAELGPADVLVHTEVSLPRLNLAPYLGGREEQFGKIAAFLQPPDDPAVTARLIVVNAGEPITTDAPTHRFGAIQIVTYTAPRSTAAAQLLADLERTLGARVGAELAGARRLLFELRWALDLPDTDGAPARPHEASP